MKYIHFTVLVTDPDVKQKDNFMFFARTFTSIFLNTNRVQRRIFGPKRVEVTREWRKLHNEEA